MRLIYGILYQIKNCIRVGIIYKIIALNNWYNIQWYIDKKIKKIF